MQKLHAVHDGVDGSAALDGICAAEQSIEAFRNFEQRPIAPRRLFGPLGFGDERIRCTHGVMEFGLLKFE